MTTVYIYTVSRKKNKVKNNTFLPIIFKWQQNAAFLAQQFEKQYSDSGYNYIIHLTYTS